MLHIIDTFASVAKRAGVKNGGEGELNTNIRGAGLETASRFVF